MAMRFPKTDSRQIKLIRIAAVCALLLSSSSKAEIGGTDAFFAAEVARASGYVIHEVSHLKVCGSTADFGKYKYGDSRFLAFNSPENALVRAASFEHFVMRAK